VVAKKKAKVVSEHFQDQVERQASYSAPPTVLWELIRDELGKRPSALAYAAEEAHDQSDGSRYELSSQLRIAAEEMKARAGAVDLTGMTKFLKESYLGGLEASLRWQEENEQATRSIIKGGFTGFQHWLLLHKSWADESLDQIQRQQNANLLLTLSRHLIQASHAMTERIFEAGVEVYETTVDSYETLLASPSRRYVHEINKTMMETIIPNSVSGRMP